jgi:hypothetical protein
MAAGQKIERYLTVLLIVTSLILLAIPFTAQDSKAVSDPERIRISEVLYRSGGKDSLAEYVELFNPNDKNTNLDGFYLMDSAEDRVELTGLTMEPYSFMTIASNPEGFIRSYGKSPDSHIPEISLDNDGDWISLKGPDDKEVDFVAWEEGEDQLYPLWNLETLDDLCLRREDVYDIVTTEDAWDVNQIPDPRTQADQTGSEDLVPRAHIEVNTKTNEEGSSFVFDGTLSYDPEGEPLDYTWDFDASDPTEKHASSEVVTHSYKNAGTYSVILEVEDVDGLIDDTTITVRVSDDDILPDEPAETIDEETPDETGDVGEGNPPLSTDTDTEGETEGDTDIEEVLVGVIVIVIIAIIIILIALAAKKRLI